MKVNEHCKMTIDILFKLTLQSCKDVNIYWFSYIGPRVKRPKKPPSDSSLKSEDEKRPRTAFSGPQLARLKVRIMNDHKVQKESTLIIMITAWVQWKSVFDWEKTAAVERWIRTKRSTNQNLVSKQTSED